ncbi:MAG: nicotinate phosphoribosyltransferase, partial [Eubacteriales bacterium]|nr:nicotinate phosphoribosyltransferase [Eubacteriales bacterium]
VETALLNLINHQTLIATKASRVVYAANGDSVLEFGLRRAQGPDAGIYGARAAIIGGCDATSNVLTGQMFDIAVKGTHAHSWVMSFPTELDSFRAYADVFPDTCMLLVDTYDTLRSGVPNAIKCFDELRQKGYEPIGIRLDSGDMAYLSKKARAMLDAAGYEKAKIFASSDLDETVIRDLKAQGACIDVWGVGTRLITSDDCPALGGVYKMSAEVVNGVTIPKIKISDNPAKVTNPGYKKVYRLYRRKNGKAIADLIALADEVIDDTKPLRIFDPVQTWKSMVLTDFTARELLVPIFQNGKQVYESPDIKTIQSYAKQELATMWEEYKRLLNPHVYKVDLSDKLYDLKQGLLRSCQPTVEE